MLTRRIYASSNGDVWDLTKDESGNLFILHTPTQVSGGKPSSTDLGAYLSSGVGSPQREALLNLIATLTNTEMDEEGAFDNDDSQP